MNPTTNKQTPVTIPDRIFFRIGDVAEIVGLKPYVLRYWETEFPMIAPQKASSGHRVYRRVDVETVLLIKRLLYVERYSIEGARKKLKELRSEGELKTARRETVAPSAAEVTPGLTTDRREKLERMLTLARDLRSLAKTPLRQIF